MFRDWFKPRKSNRPQMMTAPTRPIQLDTILGGKTDFKGTLKCQGNVRVEGIFLGDITTKGKIAIGEAASVEGNLISSVVSVSGILRGDVTARKVYVTHTGRLWGDLTIQTLATEEGGFIQGLITMKEKVDIDTHFPAEIPERDEEAEEKKPDLAKKAPSKASTKS